MKKIKILILLIFILSPVFCQDPADYLMKAEALISAGNNDQAIGELSVVLNSIRDHRLFLQRARAYENKGDFSAAINDYNEANKINPNSGEYGLARIYALKGDAQTAVYHLNMNLSSELKRSEKEILLDPAFGTVENKPEWRNFWRKEHYSGLEKGVSEIEFYTSSGKTDDARTVLSQLKETYPASDEIAYSEALVAMSSGKPAEAVRMVAKIAEQPGVNEKYLRLLATAQLQSSNAAGASMTYSRLIQSGVTDAGLLLSRAECYRKTGENDKAIADIDRYLSYYPGDMNALRLAGKTQSVAGDNLKAMEIFSKNLQLHPNEADLYVDRGNSYLAARSWDWAIKDYSMSLDLKPGNSDAWLNKGIALMNTGKKEEACHDFRKALSLGNKRASEFINRNCIK